MDRFRLGVDIGGTFTDFSLLNEETGEIVSFKYPSTPTSPTKAVRIGLTKLVEERHADIRAITHFVHGSTIAVNTLLQRNGANLALFATSGFADLLEIQRLRLPNVYDITGVRPKPLVPRRQTMQIKERILADGTIEVPLDKATVLESIQKVLSYNVSGVVICFINSYKNSKHELDARDIILGKEPMKQGFIE